MTILRLKSPAPAVPAEPLPSQETVDRVIAEVCAAHRDIHAPQIGIGRVSSHVRKGRGERRKRS